MNTVLLALLGGLAAGAVHVLTGPDHLAAVLPLAARARQTGESRGFAVGSLWGLGHGLGVIVLGGLGLLLREVVDIDAASSGAELIVGAALVGLGVWTLRRSRTVVVHDHGHIHAEKPSSHTHVHVHIGDETVGTTRHESDGKHEGHRHGAFAFGLLHGLAGTSHLVAALPALALAPIDSISYIIGYLSAAIPLMALVSGAVFRMITQPSRIAPAMQLSGGLAATVGLVWMAVGIGLI